MNISTRDKEIWRAALTLANNICVQESDAYNDDDETERSAAAAYCAQRLREWLEISDAQFAELLAEAGVAVGG